MNLTNRHQQCLEALSVLGPSTAREVANYLHDKGYTKMIERNIAHPRLNELENGGYVESIGTKWDEFTERDVTVYQII
jgi:predicted HTH transcriptional regulator